jgi:hypothetical protein
LCLEKLLLAKEKSRVYVDLDPKRHKNSNFVWKIFHFQLRTKKMAAEKKCAEHELRVSGRTSDNQKFRGVVLEHRRRQGAMLLLAKLRLLSQYLISCTCSSIEICLLFFFTSYLILLHKTKTKIKYA